MNGVCCGHEMERGNVECHRAPKPLAEHNHQHKEEVAIGLGTRVTKSVFGVRAAILRRHRVVP